MPVCRVGSQLCEERIQLAALFNLARTGLHVLAYTLLASWVWPDAHAFVLGDVWYRPKTNTNIFRLSLPWDAPGL
jgi:hypothetical protein